MAEPEDKHSREWKDWFIRHTFGPMVAEGIKTAAAEDLDILIDFVREIKSEKAQENDKDG